MPKLVVMNEGIVLMELELAGKETLIGRDADCDIRLDDPAVSRHHAKVARIYAGYFIEDLHSTNGVMLNNRRVRKHMLKNRDIIQVGDHELHYDAGQEEMVVDDQDQTVVHTPAHQPREQIAPPPPSEAVGRAYVRHLSGPDQGDSKLVDKSLYTLGKPGGDLAVISRRAQGYFLLHLGGDSATILNGKQVHGAGIRLSDGDQIQVGEIRMEFNSEP